MLANIWLKSQGQSIVEWPETVIGSKSIIREEYLRAIRAADDGDEKPLALLHSRYSGESYPSFESH